MNKTTQTSQTTSNTYNSYFNVYTPMCSEKISNIYNSSFNADTSIWIEARGSEEEGIGMRKGRRKSNAENTNEEVKGKSSEEEEIKYLSVA